MRKIYLLHPFLFALAPAVFLWAHNFQEVLFLEVLEAMVVVVIYAGIVFALCKFLFRDFLKASIFASVFLLLTLSFQYVFFNAFTIEYMRTRYALFIAMAIITVLGYALLRTKRNLIGITKILTVAAGAFILISFFQAGLNLYVVYTFDVTLTQIKTNLWNEIGERRAVAEKEDDLRDIYYIIFDQYANPGTLKKVLGYEEAYEIVDFLQDRGFFVVKDGMSNYVSTSHSFASFLNMQYIGAEKMGSERFLGQMIKDNFIKDFLRTQGYRFIQFGTWWPFTYHNEYADENVNIGFLSPHQMALWEITAFSPIERKFNLFTDLWTWRLQWERENYKLNELTRIPQRNEPTFVLAHMMIPHPPYVFDPDGNFITKEEAERKNMVDNYLGQVTYVNKQIKKLVDEILEISAREPIIIIQGDHGLMFDWKTQEQLSLDDEEAARLGGGILAAYYFPDGGESVLYDSITPVNSFRALLNYYFKQNLEFLEDRTYVGLDNSKILYEFIGNKFIGEIGN